MPSIYDLKAIARRTMANALNAEDTSTCDCDIAAVLEDFIVTINRPHGDDTVCENIPAEALRGMINRILDGTNEAVVATLAPPRST